MKDGQDLPLGLSMALAQNTPAMQVFSNMTEEEQQEVINHTHQVSSRNEMRQYVQSLAERSSFIG